MGITLRVLLLVVTLLSIGMQLRTAMRTTAGLSAATWLGLMTSTMLWFGYGVATGEMTLITINLPVAMLAGALIVVLIRREVTTARKAAPYVLVPMALWVVAWASGEPAVLGWGGTVLVVGRLLPQLLQAARVEDRSGISVGAWIGNGSNKIVWAVYGFTIGDAFVAWPSAVASVVSFSVVLLCLRGRTGNGGRGRPMQQRLRVGFAVSAEHPAPTMARAA